MIKTLLNRRQSFMISGTIFFLILALARWGTAQTFDPVQKLWTNDSAFRFLNMAADGLNVSVVWLDSEEPPYGSQKINSRSSTDGGTT
jgi:hypothetical protein